MGKRLADKRREKREKELWGKGTVICKSWDEFESVTEQFNSHMVSPGTAAARLGVSRSYVNQLEKEGKLRAYRIIVDDKMWKHIPFWLKVFAPRKAVYILIPDEDIQRVKSEMIGRAKEKIKKLEGKE
jgi:hypothetical protein